MRVMTDWISEFHMDLVQEPNTIFLLPASSMNLVRLQFTAGRLNCFDIKTILPWVTGCGDEIHFLSFS
jgi:hypothetical protein